jgi:hypothetical protein
MRFPLPLAVIFCATQTFKTVESFSSPSSVLNDSNGVRGQTSLNVQASNPFMDFFTSAMNPEPQQTKKDVVEQRRELGSQELLMLPRQYSPNPDVTFPSLNHVSCAILSTTPSESVLKKAINQVMAAHPLLLCKIEGDGEPEKRIDLLNMVRKGETDPCTFVSKPHQFSADNVLKVVDVPGSDRAALDASWQESFVRDLDDGSWCEVDSSPLWKVELHRQKGRPSSTTTTTTKGPCALLFSFNHAISDQNSASRLTDQIVSVMAEIEEKGRVLNRPVSQEMPLSVEESVLGRGHRWADIQNGGFSLGTIKYVAGKAAEETKRPVVLPDGTSTGGGVLGALSTISGNAAGGEDENSLERKSTLQFRSLSSEATSALLAKSRENGVSITNALSAAATLTATDFVDNGKKSAKERNYKVLQSLDMGRFSEQLHKGESVGCLAGSMDLMHGPLPDRFGEKLRSNPNRAMVKTFWNLAKEGKDQTAVQLEPADTGRWAP